jgi:ATP-dependent Clp protease adapter protein ClpS
MIPYNRGMDDHRYPSPRDDENPYQSPGTNQNRFPSPDVCTSGKTNAVVVLNDEVHTFIYVIQTFMNIFGYSPERCHELAMAIHTKGRAIVWVGCIEIAELARDEIRSAGPDRYAAVTVEFPLNVVIEPIDAADAKSAVNALKLTNEQSSPLHTIGSVLWWGGAAVVVASWVDAVTPKVGWTGFAVACGAWLILRSVKPNQREDARPTIDKTRQR